MNGTTTDERVDVATATLASLNASIDDLLAEIKAMDEWRQLTDASADPERVRAILREVYREVALYQPDVIEATIAVIGQFPRSLAAKQLRTMLIHQAEEWDAPQPIDRLVSIDRQVHRIARTTWAA